MSTTEEETNSGGAAVPPISPPEAPESRQEKDLDLAEQELQRKRARKELTIVISIAVVVVIAVVTAVSIVATNNKPPSVTPASAPEEAAPVTATLITDPQPKLDYLLLKLGNNSFVSSYVADIATDVSSLAGKDADDTLPPHVRAASFAVKGSSYVEDENIVRRFALAYLYYNNGGTSWTDSENWMTDTDHCTWKGVNVSHSLLTDLLSLVIYFLQGC